MPKKKTKKRTKKTPISAKIVIFLIFGLIAGELTARIMDKSLYEAFLKATGIKSTTRMEQYGEQPSEVYYDLVYLSYLDSLAEVKHTEAEFAVPDMPAGDRNILRMVLEEAGIPKNKIRRWGIPDSNSLKDMYLEMYSKKRINLPKEGLPLMFDIREGIVKTGYVLFGRYEPFEKEGDVDFCAVVTSASKLWPERSKIMFFSLDNPDRRPEIVHCFLDRIPQITYFGCGVPGDDLAGTFEAIIRPEKNKRIH
ncbi:MAG: hypothetical protein GY863_05470 [bacterium]|nr:hypothetical protein [bacterium]